MAKQTWQKKFLNEIMKQSNLRKNEFSDAPFWLSKDKIELLPKSLVKFFSPNIYSFLSLNNKSLYFATPSSFNDPYDCYLGANNEEYVKKYLLKYIEDNSFIEERIITEDERNRLSESRAFDSGDYYNIYESFSSAFNSIVLSKEEEKQNKLRLAKIIANRNFEYTIKNLRN
ncbi:MAG: hypothetical protein HN948_07310, partial [Clostridia bacterium]|nr:hypothetical protein [Clostridia bacterium]